MDKYLLPEDFKSRFPRDCKLGGGTFSTVYTVKDSSAFVIKDQRDSSKCHDFIYEAFAKELNVYSRFHHVGICELEAWTIYGSIPLIFPGEDFVASALIISRGILLLDAFDADLITAKQVAADLLAAVAFLHRNGIVHNDIEVQNVVVIDGRAKLIDFGHSQLATDDRTYHGAVYSDGFRDPQVCLWEDIPTSIKADLYAVGIVLYSLYKGCKDIPLFGSKVVGDTLISNIIADCTHFPISERLDAEAILRKYDFEITEGTVVTGGTDSVITPGDQGNQLASDHIYCLALYYHKRFYNVSMRTFFHASHLFHLTGTMSKKELKVLAQACLFIAMRFNETTAPTLKQMIKTVNPPIEYHEITRMIVGVFRATRGIIASKTYWHYANNSTELVLYYRAMLTSDYLRHFPLVPAQPTETSDPTISSVLGLTTSASVADFEGLLGGLKPLPAETSYTLGVTVMVEPVPTVTILSHIEREPSHVLYYYDQLDRLDVETSNKIYKLVVNGARDYCKRAINFDYNKYHEFDFAAAGFNPFKVSDIELAVAT